MTYYSRAVGEYLDRHDDGVKRLAEEVSAAVEASGSTVRSTEVAGYLLDHVVADPRDISAMGETDPSV